jgi:hypothetical protein
MMKMTGLARHPFFRQLGPARRSAFFHHFVHDFFSGNGKI